MLLLILILFLINNILNVYSNNIYCNLIHDDIITLTDIIFEEIPVTKSTIIQISSRMTNKLNKVIFPEFHYPASPLYLILNDILNSDSKSEALLMAYINLISLCPITCSSEILSNLRCFLSSCSLHNVDCCCFEKK